jgi:PhnB protein
MTAIHDGLRRKHPTVSVYMMASDADAVIAFVAQVFGGEVDLRHDREDGTLMHASLRIGDSVVMLSQGTQDYAGFPVWLHVYVDDVDATYAKALAFGAESIQAPSEKGDGDRRGGVRDAAGNSWWIATPAA